jgi:hypothetical protein
MHNQGSPFAHSLGGYFLIFDFAADPYQIYSQVPTSNLYMGSFFFTECALVDHYGNSSALL